MMHGILDMVTLAIQAVLALMAFCSHVAHVQNWMAFLASRAVCEMRSQTQLSSMRVAIGTSCVLLLQ